MLFGDPAAGVPDDRMPIVTIREEQHTPATQNSENFAKRTLELFAGHFGAERTTVLQPFMVGEDVGGVGAVIAGIAAW